MKKASTVWHHASLQQGSFARLCSFTVMRMTKVRHSSALHSTTALFNSRETDVSLNVLDCRPVSTPLIVALGGDRGCECPQAQSKLSARTVLFKCNADQAAANAQSYNHAVLCVRSLHRNCDLPHTHPDLVSPINHSNYCSSERSASWLTDRLVRSWQ